MATQSTLLYLWCNRDKMTYKGFTLIQRYPCCEYKLHENKHKNHANSLHTFRKWSITWSQFVLSGRLKHWLICHSKVSTAIYSWRDSDEPRFRKYKENQWWAIVYRSKVCMDITYMDEYTSPRCIRLSHSRYIYQNIVPVTLINLTPSPVSCYMYIVHHFCYVSKFHSSFPLNNCIWSYLILHKILYAISKYCITSNTVQACPNML